MLIGFVVGAAVGFFVRHFSQPLLAKAKALEAEVEKVLK
jgi:uncharacterized membrane-anchored protein YhcB (DUF1043 family)